MLPLLLEGAGSPLALALAALASYLLGGVPFGLLLGRWVRGVDLRRIGSGNIGATNTMRALGRGWGLFAFALDFGKGWLPVALFAGWAAGEGGDGLALARLVCGAAAVLGHCFPVYLRFKGGKGVATGCGAVVAVDPIVFLIGGAVWVASLYTLRFVGLSSILMGLAFPVAARLRRPDDVPLLVGCALLALLIVVRHRGNIARMLAGKEPRSGRGKEAHTGHG